MRYQKVDVVVVTYNSSKKIEKLIDSLASSIDFISTITIIENNSPEAVDTNNIVSTIAKKHQKLSVKFILNKDNRGFGSACNQGARLAKAPYILFINPDTQADGSALKTLLAHAKQGNYDIIGGLCVNDKYEIHRTAVRKPDLLIGMFEFSNIGKLLHFSRGTEKFYYLDKNIYQSETDTRVDAVSGAYLMIKRDSFIKLNGFDEDYFMYLEDVDLGVRAKRLGMKVYFCPHSRISHIGGASSGNKYHIVHNAWFQSRKIFFKKNCGPITNILLQPTYILEEVILKLRLKILNYFSR